MSVRVLLPNDIQNLIDEIRPYLAEDMKEIDVIRTVLVDFKLNRKSSAFDQNGFNQITKSKLLKAKHELDEEQGIEFNNFEEVLKYAKNSVE